MFKIYLINLLLFIYPLNQLKDCNFNSSPVVFKLGNEVLLDDYSGRLKNKRIAVLTNQTGLLGDGTHIIDALISKGINVVKIFSPEHGIRGDENYSGTDTKTGIPIVSLYGGKTRPDASDLGNVDIIIYDIQDVGARFYTYTSTLYYTIQAAIENNKTMYVCDRPVMLNPGYVDGFMPEEGFKSFVASIPAPVCYGMTCGELAGLLSGVNAGNLVITVKMQGYTRSTDFDSLNLPWVKPSPNIYTSRTAVCYPATCFLEGTNVSEGRGSEKPFEYFGAPWINSTALAGELNSYGLAGVKFEPISFTPSEKVSAYPPKYFNKLCSGIYINVTSKFEFEPVKCGAAILISLYKLFSEFSFNKDNYIDKLAGTDRLRKSIINENSFESVISSWSSEVSKFNETRDKFLLYR